jgi:alpha-beta hydrolase superfamily lysophospholipase
MRSEQRTIRTRDGLMLARRDWPLANEASNAKGTVVIVHGLGEHIGRYAHVAARLNASGWAALGYDQRGHGTSPGARGRLAADDDLLADLAALVDEVQRERADRGPLVLLGHSLGGLVAARFVAGALETPRPAWQRDVDALVLSSPALDVGMTLAQRALLATLGAAAPNLAVANGLDPNGISREPAVVAAYRADSRVHDRIAPRLGRFLADAGPTVRALAPRWRVPTLLLYAGSDRLVLPAGSAAFAAAAPAGIVTTREFPALFHEIFNEPERDEVLSVLTAWLDTLTVSPHTGSPR